jgi:heat shock protein HslJ
MSTHPRMAPAGLVLLTSVLAGCGVNSVQATGEISFTASCNHFSGMARWDDGVLHTGALGGTEMGCPDARRAQDEWMVDFFGSGPAIHRDGTDVRLRSGQDVVRFVPADVVDHG